MQKKIHVITHFILLIAHSYHAIYLKWINEGKFDASNVDTVNQW